MFYVLLNCLASAFAAEYPAGTAHAQVTLLLYTLNWYVGQETKEYLTRTKKNIRN